MKVVVAFAVLSLLATGCGPSHVPRTGRAEEPAVPARAAPAADQVDAHDPIDDGVVVPEERHVAGQRYTITQEMSIKSTVAPSAVESIRFDVNQDKQVIVEVLEVDGGRVTRERVTVTIDEARTILGKQVQRQASVLAGKTYVITHSADPPRITYDDGRTPPRAEIAALRNAADDTGEAFLQRVLVGRRWYPDQQVQLGADALEAFNQGGNPRARFTSYELVLRDVARGVATFSIVTHLEIRSLNGPISMDLSGTMEIDLATGHTRRISLRGPVRGDLGAPLTGEGTLTFRSS